MLLIYFKHSSTAFKHLPLWFETWRISRLCWNVFFLAIIYVRSYRPRWSVSSLTAIINRKVIPVSFFVFQRTRNNINAGRTSSGKFFTVSVRWVCFTWQGLRLWSQPIYNYRTCLSGGEIVILIPTLAVISAIKKRFLDPNYLPGTLIRYLQWLLRGKKKANGDK